MSDRTRRAFISAMGVSIASSLAGCSAFQTPNEEDTSKNYEEVDLDINEEPEEPVIVGLEYPSGYSERGISNFQKAIGQDSSYYDLDSVSIQINSYRKVNSELTDEYQSSIKSSGKNKLMEQSISENGSILEKRFQDFDTVYLRSSDSLGVEINEIEYDRADIYIIPMLRKYLSQINLSIESLTESHLIYTASLEDISDNSIVFKKLMSDPESASIRLEIRKDGVPVRFEIQFKGSDGADKVTEGILFKFSSYNAMNILTPGWVKDAKDQ